jgi:DNA-binding beta-propeller fold protein YncE
MRISCFLAAMVLPVAIASPVWAEDALSFRHLSTYETGQFDESAAEISAYSAETKRLYVVNADAGAIDVLDVSDPSSPQKIATLASNSAGAGVNSVAVHGDLIAVALVGETTQEDGKVVFFDLDGNEQGAVNVGANPDMLTFTQDGTYVVVANEGEPSDDYTNDPDGSISIISVADKSVRTAGFETITELPDGMRVGKPGAAIAADMEPEYVAISPDGKTAYVALQENNGVAIVDIAAAKVTGLFGFGYKDHSVVAFDASNKDGGTNIRTWPVMGMYQPDAIAAYDVAGQTYLVTANEGDARDYDGWSEETRVAKLTLDPVAFPNADELQADGALGRLKTTTAMGDTDGDGDHDVIYSYGARSFSIWSTSGDLVFDSGSQMERLTSSRLGPNFNSNNDENDSGDKRSDDKGPEPEGVVLGQIEGKTIAFIGLERVGGVMAYDISDPENATFLGYANNRNFDGNAEAGKAGDLGPEGLTFIPAAISPNGKDLLVVANEVSGTTTFFEIDLR